MSRARVLAQAAHAELARRDLLAFATLIDEGFRSPPHIVYVARLLEKVERGELTRLCVIEPPGHGKSTLLARFMAHYLGRDSRRRIITGSASQELADRNSRNVRAIVDCQEWPFEARLSSTTFAQSRWDLIPGNGGLFSAGVGAAVTGWRANLLLCDDIVHDEGGQAERDTTWRWLTEIAMPRLEPDGAIVIIGTRWSQDDIFGRIMEAPDAGDWTFVVLPAEARENDPLGREVGAPLWPERFSAQELTKRRIAQGSRSFDAQYNCDPTPLGGSTFQRSWFNGRFNPDSHDEFERVVISVDPAASTSSGADNSAIVVAASSKTRYYIVDCIAGRWPYTKLREMVLSVHAKNLDIESVLVESSSNGLAVIDELRQTTRLPIVPIVPRGSKGSRAESVTGLFESGAVLLPEGAPWIREFVDEMTSFSPLGTSKHDDRVDACVQALVRLRERKTQGGFCFAKLDSPAVASPFSGLGYHRNDY